MDPIQHHLTTSDDELAARWEQVEAWIGDRFGRDTTIEAILFLIGVQSRGQGYEPDMVREKKEDTIMEGTYCVLEKLGLYERIGLDEKGFWIWERCIESIPKLPIEDQEKLLKLGIVLFFDEAFSA